MWNWCSTEHFFVFLFYEGTMIMLTWLLKNSSSTQWVGKSCSQNVVITIEFTTNTTGVFCVSLALLFLLNTTQEKLFCHTSKHITQVPLHRSVSPSVFKFHRMIGLLEYMTLIVFWGHLIKGQGHRDLKGRISFHLIPQ